MSDGLYIGDIDNGQNGGGLARAEGNNPRSARGPRGEALSGEHTTTPIL